jgi:hypothetical protein
MQIKSKPVSNENSSNSTNHYQCKNQTELFNNYNQLQHEPHPGKPQTELFNYTINCNMDHSLSKHRACCVKQYHREYRRVTMQLVHVTGKM